MTGPDREACGRCSFSTVVDAVDGATGSGDATRDRERRETGGSTARLEADDRDATTADSSRDPLAGGHIEVDERQLRLASAPSVLAGRAKRWLDERVARLAHGR